MIFPFLHEPRAPLLKPRPVHVVQLVLYHKKDMLDVWGSFFFIGSETTRIRTKIVEARAKETLPAESYMTWMQNKGGEVGNVRVKPYGKGVGLFATKDIAKGDVIAEIPYVATLGPETALK